MIIFRKKNFKFKELTRTREIVVRETTFKSTKMRIGHMRAVILLFMYHRYNSLERYRVYNMENTTRVFWRGGAFIN